MTKNQIDQFLYRLDGPDGCNMREVNGRPTWNCPNDPAKPLSRRILEGMGIPELEQEMLLGYVERHGGVCDCEIMLNAMDALEDINGFHMEEP